MTRRVLIITTGETPQLVTEALYALLTQDNPWVPDELLLATTASGRALFEQGGGRYDLPPLLGDGGKLGELCAEFSCPLPAVDFILPQDAQGRILPDIRAGEEVTAFANALFARVSAITADPDTQLHLSIAGGRKTMSFIAGQIMSFCARRQDEMSHCLVHPQAKEQQADFWWPSQKDVKAGVRIDLHKFDFLKVAAFLNANKIFSDADWGNSVSIANENLAIDGLQLDFGTATITAGSRPVKADRGREFAVIALICLAQKLGVELKGRTMGGCGDRFWRNWARCCTLVDLDRWYDGDGRWAALNLNRANEGVAHFMHEAGLFKPGDLSWPQHWNDLWSRPKSDLARKCKNAFAPVVYERIFPATARRDPVWTTGFLPDNIEIVFPAGFDLDFFRD